MVEMGCIHDVLLPQHGITPPYHSCHVGWRVLRHLIGGGEVHRDAVDGYYVRRWRRLECGKIQVGLSQEFGSPLGRQGNDGEREYQPGSLKRAGHVQDRVCCLRLIKEENHAGGPPLGSGLERAEQVLTGSYHGVTRGGEECHLPLAHSSQSGRGPSGYTCENDFGVCRRKVRRYYVVVPRVFQRPRRAGRPVVHLPGRCDHGRTGVREALNERPVFSSGFEPGLFHESHQVRGRGFEPRARRVPSC